MSHPEQEVINWKTRSRSPSPTSKNPNDIITIQKELKDKENELNIAYQTSLELIETNNEFHQHLEEQTSTIQTLDANILDYQMKIHLLEAENSEYQQTIFQTNDKYEQLLGELAVTREHLNNTHDEISEYQRTIQSLNHDIINNKQANRIKSNQINNKSKMNNDNIDYKDKLLKQQKKYDELLRECEKLRNESEQLIDAQIEIENVKKEQMKFEKRNKVLSDEIVNLTHNNVELEKEINEYTLNINEQNETIKYLQTENQNLMTKKLTIENKNSIKEISSEPNELTIGEKAAYNLATTLSSFVHNKENIDLKRRLSIQLRDNFSDNSKLVMFANTIDEKEPIEEENDLFTMVQNYENNDEYLRNSEIEENSLSDLMEENKNNMNIQQPLTDEKQKSTESISPERIDLANKSRQEKVLDTKQRKEIRDNKLAVNSRRNVSIHINSNKNRKKRKTYRTTDTLDEYLHLTVSAVKINYPTINATSKELIEMVKSLPFYEAHDHLNRYMMDKLRWEQIYLLLLLLPMPLLFLFFYIHDSSFYHT